MSNTRRFLSIALIVTILTSTMPQASPTRPTQAFASARSIRSAFDEAGLSPLADTQALPESESRITSRTAAAGAQVSVVAPVSPIQGSENFTVAISIAQVDTPLSAFQFDLAYDPAIITYVSYAQGDFLASSGRTIVCPTPVQVTGGTVRFACASTGPMRGPTGEGTLAVLTFQALSGGESDLTLSNAQLPDDERPPTLIAATSQDGHVVVESSHLATNGAILANQPTTSETADPADDVHTVSAGESASACYALTGVEITGPPDHLVGTAHTFTATVAPPTATLPITYTWTPPPEPGSLVLPESRQSAVTYIWDTPGAHVITATATNECGVVVSDTHTVIIRTPAKIYLPLVLNNWVPSALPERTCFWADLDCDHDVDGGDLHLMAESWNCTTGQPCHDKVLDRDGDDDIDALDMATLGNQYDITPPEISLTTPAEGQAVGENNILVSGMVTDTHTVVSVIVNDAAATLNENAFATTVSLESGNHTLNVVAEDELGQKGIVGRVVSVDSKGPMVEIHAPRNRQAVYTLNPSVAISYTDFYAAVNVATFHADLNGVDVTADLTPVADGATGTLNVAEDTAYTLTVTIEDSFGNAAQAQSAFYVPPDPDLITLPDIPDDAGWVSGVIYDSNTCDEHLTECPGLAGVRVTLERVDEGALQSVRAARQREITTRLATLDKFVPLSPQVVTTFTMPISGTIVTGPDGFFAFPLPETGHYWLRAEKDGYTYGQREAEVVKERSAATNAIYLTPLDPAETACDEGGCTHTSADGMVEVYIPADAIPAGEVVTTTATNFEQVEFLPSGELPPGTQETYAFNLGGDSEYEFQEPVMVRLRNDLDFNPGTKVPLGYWNQATQEWEHAGAGVVGANGEWIEMQVTHFSNYDCNAPVILGGPGIKGGDGDQDGDGCQEGEQGCFILLKSGTLKEDVTLPPVNILGEQVAPTLLYSSRRADPSRAIDVELSVNPSPGVELYNYVGFELYIEGQKTDSFFISNTIQSGEVGRYRYLWDGRDAQGNLLPPGVYEYRVKLSVPYRAQYCLALGGVFGNPPDCERGATGVFVDIADVVWVEGTIEMNTQVGSPLGNGWVWDSVQRLYEDEAGRIVIVDGDEMTEFYTADKDRLTEYYGSGGGMIAATSRVYGPSLAEESLDKGSQTLLESSQSAHRHSQPSRTNSNMTLGSVETLGQIVELSNLSELPRTVDENLPPSLSVTSPDHEMTLPNPKPMYRTVPSPLAQDVGGVITANTTWTLTNSPYIVTDDVTVMDGVTLTIEAGVTVIFENARDLFVNGNLIAVGTSADPITFTGAVSETRDYWGQVRIGGSFVLTDSDRSRLSYVTIEGGGYASLGSLHLDHSAPTMDHLTIRNGGEHGIYGYFSGSFTLDTATIEDNDGDGLYLYGGGGGDQVLTNLTVQNNGGDGLDTRQNGHITITNATLSGNGLYGIYVDTSSNGITLRDSTITGNGVAARLGADALLENNTWSGNTRNEIEWIGGAIAISDDRAWTETIGGLDTYRVLEDLIVADGVTLTIGAGVTVIFENARDLLVNGNLIAVGTTANPITFTGAVSETRGYWGQVHIGGGTVLTDSDRSRLSYVTIEGGGYVSVGSLHLDRSAPTMDHLTIRNSGDQGIYGYFSGPFTLDTATIEDNDGDGLRLYGGEGGQVLTNLTMQNNGGDGLEINHGRRITVTNATLSGNGLYGIYVPHSDNKLTLRDSFITGNGVAARLPVNTLLENNLWSRNIRNEVEWLGGTLTHDCEWSQWSDSPVTYRVIGDVTVADGVTLTIHPGVDVRFYPASDLFVQGTLRAAGTITTPITFKSLAPDWTWGYVRIGGGSVLTDSDRSHLSFVMIVGSSGPVSSLYVDRSTPTLYHLTIRDGAGHGLYAHDSESLEVTFSYFFDNADHGIYNNTPSQVVTATYNYWGAASGPYHPDSNPGGLGQQVSDGVVFDPWLREPVLDLGITNRTASDYTALSYNPDTGTYTRIYPDGKRVHFDTACFNDHTLDRLGNKTSYTYNADGSLATMAVTPAGDTTPRWTWTFSYTDGALSTITDPGGRVTAFSVDEHNHLTQVTFPDNATRRFTYDARGLITQQTDENGDISTYTYDDYGRIRSAISPQRAVYDPLTGQITLTQEVQTFTTSETGYPLINDSTVGDPDNPAPPVPLSTDLVAGVSYDRGGRSGHLNRWGNWLDETDALGRTTTYERDERNNLTRQVYPDGTCVEYTYDDKGNQLTEARMGAEQCALDPADRDVGQVANLSYTYEPRFNQVKTETDPMSNTITYVYDYEEGVGEAGNLVHKVYPPVENENGIVVTPTVHYTYNAWNLLETETDELGTITYYTYTQGTPDEASDGANPLFAPGVTPVPGLLTQVIRDYGDNAHLNQTTVSKDFDGNGKPGAVIGPGCCGQGQATHYTYDAWGRVLTEEDALGIVTKYEYDGRGNLIREIKDYTPDGTTGRNVVTTYTYDVHDQLLSERTAADGIVQETVNTYDINRNLATRTDGNGNTTTYTYDDADQKIAETDPLGHTTTYSYTLKGQLSSVTRPNSSTIQYLYDAFGRRAQEIVDAGGLDLTTIYTYDLNGNLLTETDPAGTVTCYTYDALDRRATQTRDCGGLDLTNTYAYDIAGNPARITDERGMVTVDTYDALGRPTSTRLDAEGLNLETTYSYDEAGNLFSTTDERSTVTTYEYDGLNRMTAMHGDVTGMDLVTRYAYDRLGYRSVVTDPNGIVNLTEYNAFGQPVHSVEDYSPSTGSGQALNAEIRYTYDNNLNLTAITDDNGNTTHYSYDGRNQRTQIQYADGSTVDYGYHPDGTQAWRVDQADDRVDYVYDGADRLVGKTYPDGSTQTFTYDAVGRQTSAQQTMDGHTTQISITYNALGDVAGHAQTVDGLTWTTAYAYDYPAGVVTTTYPSGVQVAQTMDALGRLHTVQQDGAPVATYAYDDTTGTIILTHANGVSTTTETDALGRILQVHTANANDTLADYRYGYDPAGNRTYMQRYHKDGHPADVYQYDGLYQLTQVWYGADATEPGAITGYDHLQWYDLDTLGNRLEVQNDGAGEIYLPNDGEKLTDPMNRYEQVAARPFGYDAKGNLLGDGVNTYTYDYENRMTGMTNVDHTAEYVCDARGWRVAKIVDSVTTYYVYNVRYQVIEERDASDQLAARYTYGAYIDEPLIMGRDGTIYVYHRDAQGSITEMSDGTGTLVERYTYDIYGTPHIFDDTGTELSTSAFSNPYLFTGRRYDPESSNYHYRARVYQSVIGRFLQMDPMGFVDGMNLYAGYFVPATVDSFGLCKGFECPKGMVKCPRQNYNPLTSDYGCGSKGNKVPDAPSANFKPSCDAHDRCYDTCGTSKASCDDAFCDQLYDACKKKWGPIGVFEVDGSPAKICLNLAFVYCKAVKWSEDACVSYTNAQSQACECKECKCD